MKYHFCYICGERTEQRMIEGRQRTYCSRCRRILYENPLPSVALVAATPSKRVLLVKRSVEPGIGRWCLPGGFVEIGETPVQAVVRELQEETGIATEAPQLLTVGTHLNGYYGDVLIIGYHAVLEECSVVPGDDVSEGRFFDPAERPSLVFRVHEDFMKQWRRLAR